MRTELSAREKIDRESDKGDCHKVGLVRVCGGVRMWLLQLLQDTYSECYNVDKFSQSLKN